MKDKRQLDRRTFLRLASMSAAGTALAACTVPPAAPPAAGPTAAPAAQEAAKPTVSANAPALQGEITWMTQGNFEDPASTSYVHKNALALVKKYE